MFPFECHGRFVLFNISMGALIVDFKVFCLALSAKLKEFFFVKEIDTGAILEIEGRRDSKCQRQMDLIMTRSSKDVIKGNQPKQNSTLRIERH